MNEKVFYFSGEETISQIINRFLRLDLNHKKIEFFYERKISIIGKYIEKFKPYVVVIDSIQTIELDDDYRAGTINTIKEIINNLLVLTKSLNISIIVVGHVTKSGQLAGPKLLEHMVDVYLTLSKDKQTGFKKLVAEKNRFGSTDVPGFFIMTKKGLIESDFPGEFHFVNKNFLPLGSVLSFFNYGNKFGLIEINTMLNKQFDSLGKRVTQNFNLNRLHIICAQIENIFKIDLRKFDIFVDVPDLIDQSQRQIDLAIFVGILSYIYKKPLRNIDLFFGGISLSGTIYKNQIYEELNDKFPKIENFFGPCSYGDLKNLSDLKCIFDD